MLVKDVTKPGMNYSPQVGDNLRGPQKNLYVPFRDTPWGPQPCPPQVVDNNLPEGVMMSGALPAGPNPNPNVAFAQAFVGPGPGPGAGPPPPGPPVPPAPPAAPAPDHVHQAPFFFPGALQQQAANVNINVNAGFNNAGFGAGFHRIPQASFGPQIIMPPIPVQAANGQWLAGPYNRMSNCYIAPGHLGAGQWAMQAVQAVPMGPAVQAVQMGQVGQSANVWTGPARGQHMQNILLRADRRPVDMCPADPNPWRFFLVKELDGGTTYRNRFTIDSGKIGKVVWYQSADGSMYAVVVEPPPADKADGDKKD